MHWFRACLSKQAEWNLFKYLFVSRRLGSSTMFAAYCSVYGILYYAGTFDLVEVDYIIAAWESGELFAPFRQAVIEVVMAGYICDSGLNKGGVPEKDRRARIHEMA